MRNKECNSDLSSPCVAVINNAWKRVACLLLDSSSRRVAQGLLSVFLKQSEAALRNFELRYFRLSRVFLKETGRITFFRPAESAVR